MDQVLTTALEMAPQVALGVLFVVALAILLREYRSLRGEVRTSVEDAVNAKLGSLLGSLQLEAAAATKTLAEISQKDERIRQLSTEFESRLHEQQAAIEASWTNIKGRLADLETQVPEVSALTARDLAVIARNAPFGQAVGMLTKIHDDPDATAADLEAAGDTARDRRRFGLALRLYKRAMDLDPVAESARLEYLCLSAELSADSREEALNEAMNLVRRTMDAGYESRLANSLMRLKQYEVLEKFCETILALQPPETSAIYAQALRDLGVAHRARGRLDLAKDCYEKALLSQPDDENVITAYHGFLRETKEYQKSLEVAARLVLLDPLDARYYIFVARALADLGRHDEARAWYQNASAMTSDGAESEILRREIMRAERRRDLAAQLAGLAGAV